MHTKGFKLQTFVFYVWVCSISWTKFCAFSLSSFEKNSIIIFADEQVQLCIHTYMYIWIQLFLLQLLNLPSESTQCNSCMQISKANIWNELNNIFLGLKIKCNSLSSLFIRNCLMFKSTNKLLWCNVINVIKLGKLIRNQCLCPQFRRWTRQFYSRPIWKYKKI